MSELHRAQQAAFAAAPAAWAYALPSDADVDDWIVNDTTFKDSFEGLEGWMKDIYQQAKISANTAEAKRLCKSRRKKELDAANVLLKTHFLQVVACTVQLRPESCGMFRARECRKGLSLSVRTWAHFLSR